MSSQPGELNRSFDGLSTAVGEKRLVESTQSAKFLGQTPLILVVVKVRNMDQACRLFSNDLHDPGMGVTQSVHAQARHKVQKSPPLRIVKKNTLTLGQH